MAIFTAVRNKKQTAGTMMGVLKYVTQACKTMLDDQWMVTEHNCVARASYLEMMTTKQQFRKTDGRQFYHFVQSFPAEDGLTLYATSGYRSYSTQKAIFERKLDRMSEKQANLSVAKPGYSEHQTGLAMDIEGETTKGTGLTEAFGESPEGIWAAEHCAEYGFIIRYPKDKTKITGYIYEPWHLRYVGREAAQEITALDVTFEEYIAMVRSDRIQWLQEETQYDDQNP